MTEFSGKARDEEIPRGRDAAGGQWDSPRPYEIVNEDGAAPVLLVCDHASRAIPPGMSNLGLEAAELTRHIAYDIGIGEVTRLIARRLDAPAVLARFSRLVVDPNRALHDPTSMPEMSDGTLVPGNRGLGDEERERRVRNYFRPYHDAIQRMLATMLRRGPAPVVVSMHSFTPLIGGFERPWQVGILWNEDPRLPVPLMRAFEARGLTVGDNEPYSGRGGHGYTIHTHADSRGLANALIELRQDLIETEDGASAWADLVAGVLEGVLDDTGLFEARSGG